MDFLGTRDWGNSRDGETVMLTGTYQLDGEVSGRLLRALPPLLVLAGDAWETPLIDLLADEIVKDEPGQEAVLDRLLDLLLIAVLRTWFARPEAEAPGWYRAYADPIVGPALRALHSDPAHPWTVAELADGAGVSRAALARRFNDLVGEPPMSFLTGWRIALAADLLREPGATVGSVAPQVGYGSLRPLHRLQAPARGQPPRSTASQATMRPTRRTNCSSPLARASATSSASTRRSRSTGPILDARSRERARGDAARHRPAERGPPGGGDRGPRGRAARAPREHGRRPAPASRPGATSRTGAAPRPRRRPTARIAREVWVKAMAYKAGWTAKPGELTLGQRRRHHRSQRTAQDPRQRPAVRASRPGASATRSASRSAARTRSRCSPRSPRARSSTPPSSPPRAARSRTASAGRGSPRSA